MTSKANKFLAVNAAALVLFSLLAPAVQAQQVYRIVGPDGKVTFSDKPPVENNVKVTSGAANSAGASVANSALPFELRQVVSKYPVTFYTGDNCGPCAAARSLLTTRGVPFTEKTVNTPDDGQALQRISGDNSLPFATIGGQQLKGFADTEWTQFLNAAGYPATSVLPSSYRQPPATPLVATVAAPAAPAAAQVTTITRTGVAAPAAAPVEPPVNPRNSNPAGIQF